jgi:hypothetical protein
VRDNGVNKLRTRSGPLPCSGPEQLLRGRAYGQNQQTYATLIGGSLDGLLRLLSWTNITNATATSPESPDIDD